MGGGYGEIVQAWWNQKKKGEKGRMKGKKGRGWLLIWGKLNVKEGERERDPGLMSPGVVQAVCLQREDERSRVHCWDEADLHPSRVLTVFSDL